MSCSVNGGKRDFALRDHGNPPKGRGRRTTMARKAVTDIEKEYPEPADSH